MPKRKQVSDIKADLTCNETLRCMTQLNSHNITIRIRLLVLVVADNLFWTHFHELKIARCSGNMIKYTTISNNF